jgi:hypothetical protein
LGLRFLIEFFSHSSNLPMFELGGSDQRSELSFRRLSRWMLWNDLEATAFLDKEAFRQIRYPDGPRMLQRES